MARQAENPMGAAAAGRFDSPVASVSALLAEIVLERLGESSAPIGLGLQAAGEEAEHGRLFAELEAANHAAMVEEPLQSVGGVLEVRHGENPARHREPHQFGIRSEEHTSELQS